MTLILTWLLWYSKLDLDSVAMYHNVKWSPSNLTTWIIWDNLTDKTKTICPHMEEVKMHNINFKKLLTLGKPEHQIINYLSIAFACGNLTFDIRMEFLPKGVSDWGSEHDTTSLHHKPVGHNRCITTQWVPRFRQWPCHFNQFFKQARVTDVPSEICETALTVLLCLYPN